MRITDAKVKKVNGTSRLKAVAEITIEGVFVVHELRVIEGNNGLFVAMPSRQIGENVYKDIAHPINAETRQVIEDAVLKAYAEAE
jgi:stage V sporulation protein G